MGRFGGDQVMKFLALALTLLTFSANAADLDYQDPQYRQYRDPPISYTGILERRVRAYSNALVIETVQEKCYSYLNLNFPRDRLIPNKQYFLMGFDPPVQEKIIAAAKVRATQYSDEETYRKGLNPGQIMSDGAWCRLVASDLMRDAKEDMMLYME
jgi:hypothetical protein